jgi:ferrochelatase
MLSEQLLGPRAPAPTDLGLLITNIGSPAAPTPRALRRYLAEFLGDPRIVELPRWLWLPVLHGVLLNTRPARSARLYRNIWTGQGAPLLATVHQQAAGLQTLLQARTGLALPVMAGMRYGQPSIAAALRQLRAAGARRVLVLPLFPQYAGATTGTTLDAVFAELKSWRWLPELRTINHYYQHPRYLQALASSIRCAWQAHGQPERLLFSFHGLPERYVRAGDPYPEQCQATAEWVAGRLGLSAGEWQVAFQSRLGPVRWLTPYTDQVLAAWGRAGVAHAQVVCPGFSADCLETLDEIGREGQHVFQAAGGGQFHYIPALNDNRDHIGALAGLALEHLRGWLPALSFPAVARPSADCAGTLIPQGDPHAASAVHTPSAK